VRINDVPLEDTFAEAFGMTAARLVVCPNAPMPSSHGSRP
jgi:formylmethanofuran:tetrahydromethanopterin formyltransferase